MHFGANLLDSIRNYLQDFFRSLTNIPIILRNGLPNWRMMRLRSHALINYFMASFLCPMLPLELEPPCPDVAKVAVLRQRASEPLSGFLDLAFGPEDSRDGTDHQGIVFSFSKGVRRTCLPGWSRFRPDRQRPQETGLWAFL